MGKMTRVHKPLEECRSMADYLKYARESHGLSQLELAEASGISSSSIAKWETGKFEPTAFNLIVLADTLHMSLDELVGRRRGMKNNIERNDKKR